MSVFRNSNSYKQRKPIKNRIRILSKSWNTENTELLVKNVRMYENLWNPENKSYKDRDTHKNSWRTVAENVGFTKDEAILKWNNIRNNYRQHLRNSKTGRGRKPNPMFSLMSFLDPVFAIKPKDHDSNLQTNQQNFGNFSMNDGHFAPNNVNLTGNDLKYTPNDSNFAPNDGNSISDGNSPESSRDQTPIKKKSKQQNDDDLMSALMENANHILSSRKPKDEWDGLANFAFNARAWAQYDIAFARRYKADMSALNAKYELEAISLSHNKELEQKYNQFE